MLSKKNPSANVTRQYLKPLAVSFKRNSRHWHNMQKEAALIKKKICMLGAFAVGKTSLVERFVHNRFHEKYLSTLGVNISQKTQEPIQHAQSGLTLQHLLVIWDIAGFEKFDHLTRSYYRGAAGALAVMDLTRPDTADDIRLICDQFLSVCPNAVLVLAGNKYDLCTKEIADIQIFHGIADQFGTELLLTSAKNGANVDRAFQCLSMKMGGSDG